MWRAGVEAGSRERGGPAGEPGRASWYPEAAIPATLARLDAVGALVPDDWQYLYAQFGQTARAVQQSLGGLPRGVVHGDAWPGNAVQTGPDTVTLIDWETSGLGLPVLDLGNCLIESLLDAQPSADGPAAWLVEPDEDRIGAVAAGIRVAAPAGCGRAGSAARGGPVRCVLRRGDPPVSGAGRRGLGAVDGRAAGAVAEPGGGERGGGPPGCPSSRGRRGNGTLRPVACSQ